MPMPITLYSFVDFDRASRVRWLAHELGLEVIEKRLNYAAAEHNGAAYRQINPIGKAPGAEFEQRPIWESGGICQTLVERFPEAGLAPAIGTPQRDVYNSWLYFAASTFDYATFEVFSSTALRPDATKRAEAIERIKPLLTVLEQHLAARSFVLGESFSLPDILIGHALVLLRTSQALTGYAHLDAYLQRLSQRPSAKHSRLFGTA